MDRLKHIYQLKYKKLHIPFNVNCNYLNKSSQVIRSNINKKTPN